MKEATKPLLRPNQVESLNEDIRRYRKTLSAPDYVQAGIDKGAMAKQLRNTIKMLDTQSPKSYAKDEVDAAIRRKDELQTQILNGMPTQEEMRRNPPGAVDKHMAWDKREKKNVLEWKNINLRLRESEALEGDLDVANIEKFRPSGGAQQLNMHGEQIQGQQFFMNQVPNSVVMDSEEIEALKEIDPELAAKLATASASVRQGIKAFLCDKGLVIKHTCQSDLGCKREIPDSQEFCWQHGDKKQE